jgi:ParB family chromosome partitioning protein
MTTSKRRSGLGSLIPGAELTPADAPLLAPISDIAVNPYQPRRHFDPAAMEELTESVRQHGILQPLTVRPCGPGYELIAGERRLHAAYKAGLREVPVIVRVCSDKEMLELALVENLQREDLNPIESARSYQQLQDEFGLSQGEIAERVGKSRPAIANTLRLLALPEKMQHAVEEGKMSEGHARALLSVDDPQRREALFAEALQQKLSVRALEALANAGQRRRARSAPTVPQSDANLLAVEYDMQAALGTKVRFRGGSSNDRGIIEIEYYSAEDLERIIEHLRR